MPRLVFFLVALLLAGCSGERALRPPSVWDTARPYRLTLIADPDGLARQDAVAEVPLAFDELLGKLGAETELDPASLHVAEVNAEGGLMTEQIPFQYDADAGTLLVYLSGRTEAVRRFHVYFGPTGRAYTAVAVDPIVRAEGGLPYQGQPTIRIDTPAGTYHFHQSGAGFAGLIDRDGRDWITYRPGGGSAGEYRGIPNLVHPEGHFHPGSTTATSRLVAGGPLRARIEAETNDGAWACTWDLYPTHATMTLRRTAGPYWFLYEGTPGGALDEQTDFLVRSDGERRPLADSWAGDLPAPEWLLFADGALDRGLVVAHHDDDLKTDQYWPMEGNMTVFGFGREYRCCGKFLQAVPARFTIGLVEGRTREHGAALFEHADRPVRVTVGAVEALPDG